MLDDGDGDYSLIRHDMFGYYGLSTQEAEQEDQGSPSVGFDGREHWARIDDAYRALGIPIPQRQPAMHRIDVCCRECRAVLPPVFQVAPRAVVLLHEIRQRCALDDGTRAQIDAVLASAAA